MKKYLATIIAVVLVAVILTGFFIAKNAGAFDPPAPTADPEENVETGQVFSFFSKSETAFSDVVGIVSVYGDMELVLKKQNDGWTSTSHPGLKVISNNVNSKLNSMRSLNGRVAYTGEITESKKYEFGFVDSKYSVSFTMADGSENKVVFGKDNQNGGSCYVWEEGTDKVYLVGVYNRTSTVITASDLVSASVFSFEDNGQISGVDISRDGGDLLKLRSVLSTEADVPRSWRVLYPLERNGDVSAIESLVTTLTSTMLEAIHELNCEDLSVYGLITDPHKTTVLSVGNSTPDRSGYYVTVDGGNDVYIVNSSYITYTDISPLSYIDRYVYMIHYTLLSRVELEILGRRYLMTYETSENSEDDRFTINGTDVNISGNDCRGDFKRIGTAMYGLRFVGLEDEPAARGELLAGIRYVLSDGTENTVECVRRDDTTMYYYFNGEYTGGYGNIYLLTSGNADYGILGTIDNLYAAMNLTDTQAG